MKRAEQMLAVVLLAFSLFMWWQSTLIESGAEFGMGPGFLPLWLSVGLALTSVGMLYKASVAPSGAFEPHFWYDRAGALRVAAVMGFYLLAILVMKPLGILISIALVMASTLPLLGCRDWRVTVLTSLLAAAFVYLIFGRWLNVWLPMGVLEELLPLY